MNSLGPTAPVEPAVIDYRNHSQREYILGSISLYYSNNVDEKGSIM